MRKMLIIVGCLCLGCFAARAQQDFVSLDKTIPTNSTVSATLSQDYTSEPYLLNVFGAYPASGTVTVSTLHTDAAGAVHTNSLGAIPITGGGNMTTNLSALVAQKTFRREPVLVQFSAATNGAFQLIGKLWVPYRRP
jgi:hypothetical protein